MFYTVIQYNHIKHKSLCMAEKCCVQITTLITIVLMVPKCYVVDLFGY